MNQTKSGSVDEDEVVSINPRGSTWHRWDPHVHTPGTARNDQYRGSTPWEDFLAKIEASTPPIRALGITDYCNIDTYVETVRRKDGGRLAGVGLLFPNVEFRLTIETNKGAGVNLHLLFSPHDPAHIERIQHFLDGLTFVYQQETFRCNRADLVRLGRLHNNALVDDSAAFSEGVNQFKLEPNQLRSAWKNSVWVQQNCLIAVAGAGRDGTSGLQGDGGAWEATRKNIEGLAHIIFTADPKQVAFYLGKGAASLEDIEKKWNGRKPCLHGSDAHEADRVGLPDLSRRCWVKGDLSFETLRHVAIEPEGRVHIGESPPRGALPGNCMHTVEVSDAPWMKPSAVPLNAGMVAVIGARGSGKTALADLIATGAFGVSSQLSSGSFLRRAADFLARSRAKISWEAGDPTENSVAAVESEDLLDAPHVQYLSQQFVEQLCSSEGLNDSLVAEIHRVIFMAHSEADRLGAEDFDTLLSSKLQSARSARDRESRSLGRANGAITDEQIRKDGLKALSKERDEKKKQIEKDKADRKTLIAKGEEARVRRLEAILGAAEVRQRAISELRLRILSISGLQADVESFNRHLAPDWVADLKESRKDAGLSEEDWAAFGVRFVGDVDGLLMERVRDNNTQIDALEGSLPPASADNPQTDPSLPLIPDDADLSSIALRFLERERERLQRLVGTDQQNARRYKQLSEKIAAAEVALAKVESEISRAGQADENLKNLRLQRSRAYQGTFDAIAHEEQQLAALYEPLKAKIHEAGGTLSKLSFSVRRTVDLGAWCEQGEALLDLRSGPFRGQGQLRRVAENSMLAHWRLGSPGDVAVAMEAFVAAHAADLRQHKPAQENFREWARKVSAWLYSTDHIAVGYGLQYEGGNIEQLSPGTRGIVLLLLYLAIDGEDERPLIIDQPEENLDPQSVFDDLVPAFREAKKRRQVIIVTHNANLVVNTDVDQVIVARCGVHRAGALPEINYECGGLENPAIRGAVCAILEGGERAFRERARRLRVMM